MARAWFLRCLGVLAVLLALGADPWLAHPLLAAPAGVDIRQNGSLTISGDLVEGSQVYIDIPIKNFGSSTSPHLHTYTEGYTAKGSLWRADGANPTAVALGAGQKVTIRVKADLWAGHIGTWTMYGVYLWNDDNNSYISPLSANGYNQALAFVVTLDIRQNGPVQVSGTLVEGNKVYLTVPVKNFSSSASPALHPYVEGQTGANNLWRADGAQPTAVVLQPGQSVTFQVQQDLWPGNAGTWYSTGVYLWNNSANSYYGPLVRNGYSLISFNVLKQATLVQDGQIQISGSQVSGGVVLLTIPVRNTGGVASVAFHPYTEGYTAKHSLWRADGWVPPGVVLQPGQSQTFQVRHELWLGDVGTWQTSGVYLWNDADHTYLSPLAANGNNQKLAIPVQAQAFSLQLPWNAPAGSDGLYMETSLFDHQYPMLSGEIPRTPDILNYIMAYDGNPVLGSLDSCKNHGPCSEGYSGHNGIDYGLPEGTDVWAANAGYAHTTTWSCLGSSDNSIRVIFVDNGVYRTVYEHVKDDQTWEDFTAHPRQVQAGDVIAHVGDTGRAGGCVTGPHLHFGVYYDQDGNSSSPSFLPRDLVDPYGFNPKKTDPWVTNQGGSSSRLLWSFRQPAMADIAPGMSAIATLDDTVVQADVSAAAVDAPATLNLSLAIAPDASAVAYESAAPQTPGNDVTIAVGSPFELGGQYSTGSDLTTFQVSTPLTVSYQVSHTTYANELSLRVYQWDASSQTWSVLPGGVNPVSKTVTGTTSRLGTFSLRGTALYAAPSLSLVTPRHLTGDAAIPITITGSGFLSGAWVTLEQTGLAVVSLSANSITVTFPGDLPTGSYALSVHNPDGQAAILPGAVIIGYQTWLPIMIQR